MGNKISVIPSEVGEYAKSCRRFVLSILPDAVSEERKSGWAIMAYQNCPAIVHCMICEDWAWKKAARILGVSRNEIVGEHITDQS